MIQPYADPYKLVKIISTILHITDDCLAFLQQFHTTKFVKFVENKATAPLL